MPVKTFNLLEFISFVNLPDLKENGTIGSFFGIDAVTTAHIMDTIQQAMQENADQKVTLMEGMQHCAEAVAGDMGEVTINKMLLIAFGLGMKLQEQREITARMEAMQQFATHIKSGTVETKSFTGPVAEA
ncbi:hypothetical protein DYU11_22740 [Fibrisoma montanum]|uniref:Uncharacterized protein n=1 Tax=Fibrisoma montanum TaxID=2305895 RepID=A0A418M2D6_9BACT|nr:hypothetical protein [Fibrisoma montanum]RIV19750.1 hypothetical protein DYU11_22740 [Fibrisoma montanum]